MLPLNSVSFPLYTIAELSDEDSDWETDFLGTFLDSLKDLGLCPSVVGN